MSLIVQKTGANFVSFTLRSWTISLQKELKNHHVGSCNQRTIDNDITRVARWSLFSSTMQHGGERMKANKITQIGRAWSRISVDESGDFSWAEAPALSFKFNHIHAAAVLTRRPRGWSVAFNIYPGIISARLIKARSPCPLELVGFFVEPRLVLSESGGDRYLPSLIRNEIKSVHPIYVRFRSAVLSVGLSSSGERGRVSPCLSTLTDYWLENRSICLLLVFFFSFFACSNFGLIVAERQWPH